MKLDEGQQRQVAQWIEQGLKLAEIQSKLAKELGVSMTYMEARFLIDDLKLRLKDPDPPTPMPVVPAPPAPAVAGPSPALVETPGVPAAGGKVATSIDQITKPGALVSGKVTFTDGQTADWYLDQTGRLGMVPPVQGYRPPQEDVPVFQQQLQDELARLGM